MRVDLLDPSAYTPPYDRALAGALAAAGADVRLLTSAFPYGEVPAAPPGVQIDERFYAGARGQAGSRRRQLSKLLRHAPEMVRYRREAARRRVDVVHAQWLALPQLDRYLLPRDVPFVITAHDVLPREARIGLKAAQKQVYRGADAVVVHSEHGRRRLIGEVGLPANQVHVIPHGAFAHFGALTPQLPPELAAPAGPVAVLPGLLRPYKGVDLLLEAWASFGDTPPGELWIVGHPRMALPPKASLPPGVTIVDRFVSEAELAGVLQAADLVVLPYREIDQSGVLYSALGLGRPMLLSDVGGFPEIASGGCADLFATGDAAALADGLQRLLGDAERRTVLSDNARAAAASTYSWEAIAAAHLDLYRTLI